jgi:hypothetical protein
MNDEDPITRRELSALLETVKVQLAAQEVATKTALAAADKATAKAETAMEKRFDNTNEWRGTVEGLQRTYLPREEFNAVKMANDERISGLKDQITANTNRGKGMGEMLAVVLSIIAVLAAVAGVLWERK